MLTWLRFNRVHSRVLVACFAVGVLAVLLGIGPGASAHSVLLGTDPDDGEQLAAAPDEVSLTFNEDITDLGTEVVITTGDGETVSDGEVEISGPVISQALTDVRPEGTYIVTWRAVSTDGHPISGEFTFTAAESIGSPDAQEEPTAEAEDAEGEGGQVISDNAEDPTDDATEDDSGGLSASTWVIIAILIVAAIILVSVLARGLGSSNRKE